MSSEEFTPDDAAKKKGAFAYLADSKPEGEAPVSPATAPQEGKYALARERREKSRAKRKIGGALEGQQLIAPPRPGFHRHWVNDAKGKLDRRLDSGYTFVDQGAENAPFETESHGLGSQIRQRVGSLDGNPLEAVLMEIPEELYQEDQQAKEAGNHKIAQSAKQGEQGGSIGSTAYTPEGSQFELPNEGRR